MKELTENQINKINKHLDRMTESQQDAYIQKLQEAGFIDKILGSLGSPTKNLAKLNKQCSAAIAQVNSIIQAIDKSTTVQDQNQKNTDKQALQGVLKELQTVKASLASIKIDDNPAPAANGDKSQDNNNVPANGNANANK